MRRPKIRLSPRAWLPGVLLGVALTLVLSVQSSSAPCGGGNLSDLCSTNFGMLGDVSPVSWVSETPPTGARIQSPILPSAGALVYDDYVNIEQEARRLLNDARAFREKISPHRERPDFDRLVQQFDYNAGFNRVVESSGPSMKTLQQRLDEADRDLRRARDLYAFLAVFAPEVTFRADPAYAALTGPDTENPGQTYRLCPAQRRADDPLSGQADWCNFAARLRQSVREAAYLRMIFGQQFTVDALGFHFSGLDIVGGEDFVRDEVKKLKMAAEQYQLAETAVSEGLSIALGSGCLVSDFYAQPEWALLSRAVEGRHTAQHHIAIRLSYLDVTGPDTAQADYRGAGQEGYVKLVGMAGQSVAPRRYATCNAPDATRPDGTMLAEMVAQILDTSEASRTLAAGRNVFGFDLRFTPARPYRTAPLSQDKGLLDEAQDATATALDQWDREVDATREYDRKLDKLRAELTELNRTEEYDIQAASGCDRSTFPNDQTYFACIEGTDGSAATPTDLDDGMIANTQECNPTLDTFEACMDRTTDRRPPAQDCSNCLILVSTMRQTRQEVRAAYLGIAGIQKQIDNIIERINAEDLRNSLVRTSISNNGDWQAAAAFASEFANSASVTTSTDGDVSFNVNALAIASAGVATEAALRQAASDVEIEDATKQATITNLLLDQAELMIDLKAAVQEYQAKLTEYNGVVGQLLHDVNETKRQRAWIQASPANDPSYRLVRDSARLALARQIEYAGRVSYLAARRAEYEYAARLPANNGFRMSDIYKARTAEDMRTFLTRLQAATNNMVVQDAEINQEDFQLSVAQHVLGLTDERLGLTGAQAETERVRRFREWVAENTRTDTDGRKVLDFTFSTSLVESGLLGQVIQQGYDRFWIHKVGGIGLPKPGNTGVGVNLRTAQTGTLGYRRVALTQDGVTHQRTRAGCIFEFRLIHPASLVGQEWPTNQPAESATAVFRGAVNGANGTRTPGFLGRPLSASQWRVEVFAGAPEVGLPTLDLQQLTDLELSFSTTYASRQPGDPDPRDCVRIDFKANPSDEGGK